MENSKIEWTHHTFNPWIGCTKVSPGCANCYAETLMATRYGRVKWGKDHPRSRTGADNWRKPQQWNKAATSERQRVFCASLADWLDDEVPIEWFTDLLALIHDTPNLDWLLLTKRPENWRKRIQEAAGLMISDVERGAMVWAWKDGYAPRNVWVGTSVEDQERADERIPVLLEIPAAVRFLSIEPLLGPVDVQEHLLSDYDKASHDSQLLEPLGGFKHRKIDWVICGGESGSGARTMHEDWARSLRDQCEEWGCAFHFKQWGGENKKAAGRLIDGRTWDELPSANVAPQQRRKESAP